MYRVEARCSAVDQLLAIVMNDYVGGFEKFNAMEDQMRKFDSNNRQALSCVEAFKSAGIQS